MVFWFYFVLDARANAIKAVFEYNLAKRDYSFGGTLLKLVTVLLPEAYLEGLDELVRASMYPSRSAAIRSAVRDMLKRELWGRRD